jgi:hypothetical protein
MMDIDPFGMTLFDLQEERQGLGEISHLLIAPPEIIKAQQIIVPIIAAPGKPMNRFEVFYRLIQLSGKKIGDPQFPQ